MTWARSEFQVTIPRDYSKHLKVLFINILIDRRWFSFHKMGPRPTPRSGHAMAAAGSKAIVLGGLPGTPTRGVDPKDEALLHILKTS